MEPGQQPIGALQGAAAMAQRVVSTGASMTRPMDGAARTWLPRTLGWPFRCVAFSGVLLPSDLSRQ